MAFSPWFQTPHIEWSLIRAEADRLAPGLARKLGDLELDIVCGEIDRIGAPRLVFDLRSVKDEDDLVPSEYFSLGPALQRKLRGLERETRLLYRLGGEGVAEQFSIQFERQSNLARRGRDGSKVVRDNTPQRPLMGLAELNTHPGVLGALPGYLEETFRILAEGGEVTATDLGERLGMPEKRASDYLGELDRLRLALREKEIREGGGMFFRYSLGL
jgi:hypothetical protein